MPSSILSPLDVMTRGLGYLGIGQEERANCHLTKRLRMSYADKRLKDDVV
jgi:hypothetical protein